MIKVQMRYDNRNNVVRFETNLAQGIN
jgi:hypothetical protein